MKKILISMLMMLLIISLVGCKENDENSENTITEKDEEQNIELSGGFNIYPAISVHDNKEANEALEKALEGYTGAGFEFIALLGTQVVNGINYCILAKETQVTATLSTSLAIVIVYDSRSECTIKNVTPINLAELQDKEDSSSSDGLLGGFTINEELQKGNILEEDETAFNEAVSSLTGAGYELIDILGTQVVAGTRYAYLAKKTTVTNPPQSELVICFVTKLINEEAELDGVYTLNLADYN